MTCRHRPGDPNCSSQYGYTPPPPPTPDATKYDVLDVEEVGTYLVLKAKYPNCSKCAYEGTKIMVFPNSTVKDAIRWREIDPHFRAPTSVKDRVAPSPCARFPGNEEGWKDALAYARTKHSEGSLAWIG